MYKQLNFLKLLNQDRCQCRKIVSDTKRAGSRSRSWQKMFSFVRFEPSWCGWWWFLTDRWGSFTLTGKVSSLLHAKPYSTVNFHNPQCWFKEFLVHYAIFCSEFNFVLQQFWFPDPHRTQRGSGLVTCDLTECGLRHRIRILLFSWFRILFRILCELFLIFLT